jgi:hypothetical protein
MAESKLCSRCRRADLEDLVPIACTASEGGSCSPCEEREAIRDQIEKLEEEITKLKAKHHALGGRRNAIHDPFIHKLPPEIGSHIFRLSLPTLDFEEDIELWDEAATFTTRVLKLGAVCRKWRQLAWTTPDLWDTLFLTIQPSTRRSVAKSLPGLLCQWLSRSGMRPLTIFFRHFGCSKESNSHNDLSNEFTIKTLEFATDLVIEVINLHSGRWRNLHLDVGADIPERLCGSEQPNQLFSLELGLDGQRSPTQKFIMKRKPSPTLLTLVKFSLTSIDIGWGNLTRALLYDLNANECLEVLRRAPALEYCLAKPRDDVMVDFGATVYPHLRSLDISPTGTNFLDAINVPSLEEWTHNTIGNPWPSPVIAMVSLLERSGCRLKRLNLYIAVAPDDLSILFQAIPSLEHLQLHFQSNLNADSRVMDDILARIFNSPPNNTTIPSEEASHQSFLPCLQVMECMPYVTAPFSWNHIPQLYRQGHRRSLALKSAANKSHISDDTALQLLKLTNEGVDLQISTAGGGNFLENFRKRRSVA